ncbi:MAG TPA: DUF5343 domain-containing protein [Gemmatimonadales bacterium]|nr:DUF5343 domain-containing protein [Gemmatimonadales bacterium]
MPVSFPYATTVNGLSTTIRQLRSAFPAKVNADTLKKLGIAAGNESSILQTLRFLDLVGDEGDKNAEAAKAFLISDDAEFGKAFGVLVRKAYGALFEHLGNDAWTADKGRLITFFRGSDSTSARVGEQQAVTFLALAGFAGHGAPPRPAANGGARPAGAPKHRAPTGRAVAKPVPMAVPAPGGIGPLSVSVRIELNLPVTEDQGVYDKIFRSIRENLVNA